MASLSIQAANSSYDAFLTQYNVADKDYDYSYPDDLDWSPKSELHRNTLQKLMSRAISSQNVMSNRYPSWNLVDRNLTAYMPMNEAEKATKSKDSRKPVCVVLPMTFAVRETLLTYIVSALLGDVYFPYEGVGPEDTVGALMLQHLVQQQMLHSKAELALHTHWSDGITYGMGIAAPMWETKYGMVTRNVPQYTRSFFGGQTLTGYSEETTQDLVWEGNRLINIDPYLFLPDPNVPIDRIQDGEFVGWLAFENRMRILEREKYNNEGLFNARYLKCCPAISCLMGDESGRGDRYGMKKEDSYRTVGTNPICLLYMYVHLIPAEWDLGPSEYPEKWAFIVANDSLILKAQPLGLNHNMFPVAVCAPDYDGYSIAPTSRLEVIYGLQETADWLFTSHIANVRKSIHNTYVADPWRVNINDVTKGMSEAGGIIRTRRASWGQGVEGAIMQLQNTDITRGNIPDASYIMQMMERVTSAAGFSQGVFDSGAPERRTAAEFQGTKSGSDGRLAKLTRLIHTMSMRDLGHMVASHTQQFQSNETFVRVSGDWQRILELEYGITTNNGRLSVGPMDLDVNYDISPINGQLDSASDPQVSLQLLQMAAGNPIISQRMDIIRMFKSLARRLGEKNIDNFQFQVMPDYQVQDMAASGKLQQVKQAA